ncbi:MAG: hypothetical protein LBS36_02820 [Oscillospiraceae bacterium]|jgi:uncharacterized ion transporter superfamily protein YfcC|nr:hypothetical protein [Oscillospiraceae bacterium]
MENENSQSLGLQLNKKTILSITAVLFAVMLLAGVLTQVIPAGEYQRDTQGSIIGEINGESTYAGLPDFQYSFWRVFIAPLAVFATKDAVTGVAVMLFIVLIGGTFLILDKGGILKYIMSFIVQKFSHKKYALLAVMTLVCMALSSVMGILEEAITLVPLAAAIALALGWDSLVGVGMSLVATAFGFTAATFNPFNIGVVQSMAGLPMFSGLAFRLLIFACVYLILFLFLFRYAKKIEKDPKKSLVYETDLALREKYINSIDSDIVKNRNLAKATRTFVLCVSSVVLFAAAGFAARFIKSIPADVADMLGYLPMVGMAVMFTTGGLLAGHKAGIRGKNLLKAFGAGVKAIAPAIPLIIFVMGITFILKEGKIIDTMLFYIYNLISGFSPSASLLIIFVFILVLESFIGSGTAKAFLIMPLVLPLADMVGITRQSIVTAFCLSDGFGNLMFPTSGVMLIAIGLVNVSYGKFLRWTWKLFAAAFVLCALIMLLAVKINYQ